MTAPDQPMLARRQLRLAVMGALRPLCETVLSPGNWPTPPDKLPALLVNTPSESKQGLGPNVPQFNTSVTLVIQGQASAKTPELAQDAIDLLAYQVENAVFEDYSVVGMVQQFLSVQTDTDINSEGKDHLAGFRMTISCELYEVFDPTVAPAAGTTWPLEPAPTVALQGENVHLDLLNVYDPTGTYASPTFPASVTPAPRTSGPDGRDEGALQIDLPQ